MEVKVGFFTYIYITTMYIYNLIHFVLYKHILIFELYKSSKHTNKEF
jgi:hypothetical protein